MIEQDLESQLPDLQSKLLENNELEVGKEGLSSPQSDNSKQKRVMLILKICQIVRHVLAAAVWIGTSIFALNVIFQYIVSACVNRWGMWNRYIPLYNKQNKNQGASTVFMMIHFIGVAIILLIGNIQMVKHVRKNYISLHRWCGRIYISCAFLTGLAGSIFVIVHGTVGGANGNIAFFIYGVIVMIFSSLTFYHIKFRKDIDAHKRWATRTYAVLLGSWLYRLTYGLRAMFTGEYSTSYNGAFSIIMDYGFYIVPIIVTEAYLRSERPQTILMSTFLAIILIFALLLVTLSTTFMIVKVWIPEMTNNY